MAVDQQLINYLRTLDIWEAEEEFGHSLNQVENDLRGYIERQNKRGQKFNDLLSLNITNKPKKPAEFVGQDENRVHYILPPGPPGVNSHQESLESLQQRFQTDEEVFAMLERGKPWVRCRIISVFRRPTNHPAADKEPVTRFKLRIKDDKTSRVYDANKYAIARIQNHGTNLRPIKRVIVGRSETSMLPGMIAYEPANFNYNRYLVLMDDGSAQYCKPKHIYPIIGQSLKPWLDSQYVWPINNLNIRYLCFYLRNFPRRNLLEIEEGERFDMFRNGLIVPCKVLEVDCDILTVKFSDNTWESLYRGSPRVNHKIHPTLPDWTKLDMTQLFLKLDYDRHRYYECGRKAIMEDVYQISEDLGKITVSKSLPKAKKSTTSSHIPRRVKVKYGDADCDEIIDVEDDLDVRDHKCHPGCLKAELEVNDFVAAYRTVSDLKVPLLLGWKRIHKPWRSNKNYTVVYYAPCKKRLGQLKSIQQHLRVTGSRLDIDYFSFDRDIDLDYVNVDMKAYVYVPNMAVDYHTRQPLENKNIVLTNQFSEEELSFDFEYRNEPFPHPMLQSKGFSFNFDFKSSCDCEDDCMNKADCPCHKLNDEAAASAGSQYAYKRLNQQISTGIFECNSLCSCSWKCPNRVVQNGIRFRLEVRKTHRKGWGVTTLDYIPRGAFICTYAAELLDDADQYGDSDMYFADLDYISVNQARKLQDFMDEDEGIVDEDDIPKTRKKQGPRLESSDSDEIEGAKSSSDQSSTTRYPKRETAWRVFKEPKEPKEPYFRDLHEVFGGGDYTLDARMSGNVGRFFNHSCDPNCFVQNIFIETHDPRFPVVAFFASRTIKPGEEITWNYNYKMGSIPGRKIWCYCGAANCKGRIL